MTDKKAKSLQRLLECAAQVFADRRFERVSINEIAELARCSTATIYAIYGSKENLFQAAVGYLSKSAPPRIAARVHEDPLVRLLWFVETRTRQLADPRERAMRRSFLTQQDLLAQSLRDERMSAFLDMNSALDEAVRDCLRAKLLRSIDADSIIYCIQAGAVHETFVNCLIHGDAAPVNFKELLRKIFTPLVSAEGASGLDAYLLQMAPDIRSSH